MGLRSMQIPLIARIISVADTYDAMTSDRSYRKARPHDAAMSEIERVSGQQFDTRLVEVFSVAIDEHRQGERGAGREVPR